MNQYNEIYKKEIKIKSLVYNRKLLKKYIPYFYQFTEIKFLCKSKVYLI